MSLQMMAPITISQMDADYLAHRAHTDNGKAYKGNGCRYCDLEYRQKAPDNSRSSFQIGSARIVAEWAEAKHNTEMPSDE